MELKSRGVASVSLWPGAVQTELITKLVIDKDIPKLPGIDSKVKQPNKQVYYQLQICVFNGARTLTTLQKILYFMSCYPLQIKDVFANGETTELSGRCIVELAKGECTVRWHKKTKVLISL